MDYSHSTVPSVEPPSTTIYSRAAHACPRIEPTQRRKREPLLRLGFMMENFIQLISQPHSKAYGPAMPLAALFPASSQKY